MDARLKINQWFRNKGPVVCLEAGQGCPLGLQFPVPDTCNESVYWLYLNSALLSFLLQYGKLPREHVLQSPPTLRQTSNDCLFIWTKMSSVDWGYTFTFSILQQQQNERLIHEYVNSSRKRNRYNDNSPQFLFRPLFGHKHDEPRWPRTPQLGKGMLKWQQEEMSRWMTNSGTVVLIWPDFIWSSLNWNRTMYEYGQSLISLHWCVFRCSVIRLHIDTNSIS